MIWIIASIPFWVASAILLIFGTAIFALLPFCSKNFSENEFVGAVMGGLLMLAMAGGAAITAAQICS